jgi:DNA-binding response OmpR family regulator
MGGQLAVESEVGAGTDFLILLPVQHQAGTVLKEWRSRSVPIKESMETSLPIVENLADAEKDIPANRVDDRPTLLIIEDNYDVVTYIQSILQQDYQIEAAVNGQEGIDKALQLVPDIIISDVMMPEKNGYEVCEALKADERTSHIPIILLTAKATLEDRIEGLQGGADAYLVKPFAKQELLVQLKNLLDIRKQLQEKYARAITIVTNDDPLPATAPTLEEVFLHKIEQFIEDNIDDTSLDVQTLCQAVNLSYTQFFRKLKALTGESPTLFIRKVRLKKAVVLLKTTDFNISEIAYGVGFSDPNYFSRVFTEEFGVPPSAVRK